MMARPNRLREAGGRATKNPEHAGRGMAQATVYFGAGRNVGIRPGDLVGAIANEAQLPSRVIGPIKISGDFSLVTLPKEVVPGVIKAFGRKRLKGQKVTVRLFREP